VPNLIQPRVSVKHFDNPTLTDFIKTAEQYCFDENPRYIDG